MPENEISVPDLTANKQQAIAAFDELIQHAQALHNRLEGVSAQARAELMFLVAKLTHAKTQL